MKLMEILIESEDNYEQQVQKIGDILLRDCQPFLETIEYNDLTNNVLQRGMSAADIPSGLDMTIKSARLTDRKPRNTPLELHNAINEIFNNLYGHPFRNGVFALANAPARTYGERALVIPIGNFDFLYSNIIDDLTVEIEKQLGDIPMGHEAENITNHPQYEQWKEKFLTELSKPNGFGYYNKFYEGAVSSGNEVMLWTKQYYVINFTEGVELEDVEEYINSVR